MWILEISKIALSFGLTTHMPVWSSGGSFTYENQCMKAQDIQHYHEKTKKRVAYKQH